MSKAYDITAACVRQLLTDGLSRENIRLELTLDTNSTDGRIDIAILNDAYIGCIECKSRKDRFEQEKIKAQLSPYMRSFDHVGILVDEKHLKNAEYFMHDGRTLIFYSEKGFIGRKPYERDKEPVPMNNLAVYFFSQRSCETNVNGMAKLLWREELQRICQSRANRFDILKGWQEYRSLRDVRKDVVAVLRARPLSKWEEKFWSKYDEENA